MDKSPVEIPILDRIAASFNLGTTSDPEDPKFHLKFWEIKPDKSEAGIYSLHFVKAKLPTIMTGVDTTGAPLFTDAQRESFLHLRGIVLDYPAGRVVCDSDGRLPNITVNDWPHASVVRKVERRIDHETDDFGRRHPWLFDEGVKFRMGFDGTQLRFYKLNGSVRIAISNNSNILATPNSRWGDNKETFMETWTRLGGPNYDEFFDASVSTSKYQHNFIIVDPSLNTGTRFNDSFILYVGSKILPGEFEGNERSPLVVAVSPKLALPAAVSSTTQEDTAAMIRSLLDAPAPTLTFGAVDSSTYRPLPPINPAEPFRRGVFSVPPINNIHVDYILLNGYFGFENMDMDKLPVELRPGGFVIAEGPQGQRAKIVSEGYNWRQALTGPNPNLKARTFGFFDLAIEPHFEESDSSFRFMGIDRDKYAYGQLFKLEWSDDLGVPREADLIMKKNEAEAGNPSYIPFAWSTKVGSATLREDSFEGRMARLRYAISLFAYAAPVSKQHLVLGYFTEFMEARRLIYQFLNENWATLVEVVGKGRGHLHMTVPFSHFPITEPIKNAAHQVIGTRLGKAGRAMERIFQTAWKWSTEETEETETDFGPLLRKNVFRLLDKERGSSIYHMSHAIIRARTVPQDARTVTVPLDEAEYPPLQ